MSNGSLDHALKKQSFLTINNKYIILYGIAEGMKYLHSQGIIHRDLKPGNILLNDNLYPYICDFGLSKLSDLSISSISFDSFVGTPVYMAPEIFLEKRLTNKVDVYSFSIIAYQLITGKDPFPDIKSIFKLQREVTNGKRPDLACIENEYIRFLLNKWWSMEPDDRPSFQQIIEEIKDERFMKAIGIENSIKVENYLSIFISGLPRLHREPNHKQETNQGKSNVNANYERNKLEGHSLNPKAMSCSPRTKPSIIPPKPNSNSLKRDSSSPRPKPNINQPKPDSNSPRPDSSAPRPKPNIIPPKQDSSSPRPKQNVDQPSADSSSPRPDLIISSMNDAKSSTGNDKILTEEERKMKELKMKADSGDAWAIIEYATKCYDRKDGEAVEYYKKAADKGDKDCMCLYAMMKLHGDLTPVDKQEAAKYFKMAADKGSSESMYIYGKMIYNMDGIPFNAEEAVHYFTMAIENGCEASMYYYGLMLYFGQGIPIDKRKAAEYFKKSADKGVENAMYNYAVMCRDGEGIPVNKKEAAEFFKKSADKGCVNGMDGYANMCKNGDGIPVSKQEAALYYQKAIDKGNVDSMFNYALMLSEGDTLLIKDQTAINLFKTAAEKRHPKSMYVYGRQLCIKSICDNISDDQYDENFELGLKYMKNAASKGDEIAIEKYAEFAFDYLNREEIDELLSFVKKASDEGNEKLKQLYSLLESKRPIGNGEKWKKRICS